MKRTTLLALVIACLLAGCDTGPKSASGFRLPDGDAGVGQEHFVSLNCTSCHEIEGLALAASTVEGPVQVTLGGQITRVKTYGELVTSIINPSHRIAFVPNQDVVDSEGGSLMRVYNDVMTVQQLIDLVAFLQSHYEVVPPEYTYYRYGYGP